MDEVPVPDAARAKDEQRGDAARHRGRSLRPSRAGLWVAVVVVVVGIAAGYVALRRVPSPSPAPPDGPPVVRGTDLVISAPAGDLDESPRVLRFSTVDGAARYRVRLLDDGDDLLWEESVPGSPAHIPAAVREELRQDVTYDIQIEALDATGARLAAAGQTSFRIRKHEERGNR